MGSILTMWSKLPERLPYQGYEFSLILRGYFVGYFLTKCLKNRGYKLAAFREGVWWEKKTERQMSSVGSDYLFKVALFDDSDESLYEAFKTLHDFLIKNNFPIREESDSAIENADFIEIHLPQLSYKIL